MENKRTYMMALSFALASALAMSSCSSSEVSGDELGDLSADELPVVDADTDMLPNSLEQPSGDTVADSAGELSPEASVDMPMEASPDQDMEANALSEAVAGTEAPSDQPPEELAAISEPDNGPSLEAPPSMNETAPPIAEAPAADNFSNDTYAAAPSTPSYSDGGTGAHSYSIRSGDTLMKIAYKVYGDIFQWKKILEDNSDRISNPNALVAGVTLKVDQPAQDEDFGGFERYLIKNGDTLGTISDDVYGTTTKWKKLWEQNDRLIKDPNRIYAGFFLKYSMTEQDRQEAERFRQMKGEPAPLAEAPAVDPGREPSSQQEAMAPQQAAPATTQQ